MPKISGARLCCKPAAASSNPLRLVEDAELGSNEQFNGNLDEILVLGRVPSAEEIQALIVKGAEAGLVR